MCCAHQSLRTREEADLLLTYSGAQDKRPEVCISLASIHPNHREKSPLAHCMVKIEKWLTRHCVFLYGLKGICLSVLNRGKEVHFTALLLMSAMYMPHLWPYSIC